MNITLNKVDAVNAVLHVKVAKEDYEKKLNKSLLEVRQKVTFPGFRKGTVPMTLVKKLHGPSAMAEQINTVVSDGINQYIQNNELLILGEPIPHQTESEAIDFNTQENFEFKFDIGLAPEISIQLTKEDTIIYYAIPVGDEMIEKQIQSIRENWKASQQNDQLTDDTAAENESIEEGKTELVENEHPEEKEIVQTSTLDSKIFDYVFGEGQVKTEEEFRSKLKNSIEVQFSHESEYKFSLDVQKLLLEKASQIQFPVDFIKRWLLFKSKDGNPESVESLIPMYLEEIKLNMIQSHLIKANNLQKYEKNEIMQKLLDWIKEQVNLVTKEVTVEEFYNSFNNPNKENNNE